MDGWMDGQTNKQTNGKTDGRTTDEQMDKQTDWLTDAKCICLPCDEHVLLTSLHDAIKFFASFNLIKQNFIY